MAHALADVGASVVCADLNQQRAERVADEVGGTAWWGDVTDRDDVKRLFDSIAASGSGLHGIVDIVGMSRYRALVDLTDDDWTWHGDIVLRHAYLLLTSSADLLEKSGGGPVTFVTSVAGIGSSPNLAAYGAFKAALISLVKSSAVSSAGAASASTRSPRAWSARRARSRTGPGRRNSSPRTSPIRRAANSHCREDIAASLLMLSLPLSRHITGQTVVVDGGLSVSVGVIVPTP